MKKIKQVVAAAALFGCMCGLAGTVTVEGKAVENARTVATELCKAALTTLGEVKEINYNARHYGADICCSEARIKKALLGEGDAPLLPGINVEDIEVNDEVVVKWEIK